MAAGVFASLSQQLTRVHGNIHAAPFTAVTAVSVMTGSATGFSRKFVSKSAAFAGRRPFRRVVNGKLIRGRRQAPHMAGQVSNMGLLTGHHGPWLARPHIQQNKIILSSCSCGASIVVWMALLTKMQCQ